MKKLFLVSTLLVLLGASAQAQLIEKKFYGSSDKTSPNAAREDVYDQAIRNSTIAMVKAEIGEKVYNENKSIIENQILKNYARFIPYMKASDVKGEPGSYNITVELKISPEELTSLIRANNLMVATGDLPLMIPLVKFTDRIENKEYSWWTDQYSEPSSVLTQLEAKLEDSLSQSMKSAHFYSFRPDALGYKPMVPQAYRVENPRIEDSVSLANYFKAKLLLAGEVELKKSSDSDSADLIVRWKGVNTANSRPVADLNRSFKITDYKNKSELLQKVSQIIEDLTEDFAGQVELGWQRGTLDTTVVKIIVAGRLPLADYTAFKKAIMDKSSAVKEVKERLLSEDQTVFEADVTGSSQILARDLTGLALEGQKFKLSKVDNENSSLTFELVQ